MTTSIWGKYFPSLTDTFKTTGGGKGMTGGMRPLDLRCGFSKAFMKGKLEDTHITQVKFLKGDKMHINGHFGCGILVKEVGFSPFFEVKKKQNTDSESEEESDKK